MAGNISLEGSIRTCKIDAGYADRVYSDRFLNPNNMVCSVWNGYDSVGRPVCPDTFMTKSIGCNSAQDRIFVENYQRPRYMEYVNLSAAGIDGDIYGDDTNGMTQWDEMKAISDLRKIDSMTGNFGMQFGSSVYPNCGINQYARAMAQTEEAQRKYSALSNGYRSYAMKSRCGM